MEQKRFTELNTPFTCGHCNELVIEHPSSSRDHCTNCLWGKHVDYLPGDRSNPCKGMLEPIAVRFSKSKEQIVYRCSTCGMRVNNIIAPDDSQDVIVELSTNPLV